MHLAATGCLLSCRENEYRTQWEQTLVLVFQFIVELQPQVDEAIQVNQFHMYVRSTGSKRSADLFGRSAAFCCRSRTPTSPFGKSQTPNTWGVHQPAARFALLSLASLCSPAMLLF